MQTKPLGRWAVVALLFGATGIGFAPILVRLSEVGPSATAFYRIFIALPVLWAWMQLGSAPDGVSAKRRDEARDALGNGSQSAGNSKSRTGPLGSLGWLFVVAGFCFAADLAFWHWSIKFTTVANSTLLMNFAPFFVTLGARFLFLERITVFLLAGMSLAFVGGAMLVGESVNLAGDHLLGDWLALVTALFYAGYLLTVKYLRRFFSTPTILLWSGLVSCSVLFPLALISGESVQAKTVDGWAVLVLLGLLSQVGGQGLITFALAHLPASLTAVTLLFQPVVAALLGWLILAERLSVTQAIGGGGILFGIALASRGNR